MVVQVGPEYALDENRIKPSVAASLTKPPADQILLALVGKLNEVSNSFTVYANRVKVIQKLYNL